MTARGHLGTRPPPTLRHRPFLEIQPMRLLHPTLLLSLLLISVGCAERDAARVAGPGEEHLLLLEDDRYVVGLLPAVGGRLVVFRLREGANVILSDPAQWPDAATTAPEPGPDSRWTAYNGHIAWLGPQHEWWIHQDANPKRRDAAAHWPPDPYLIYGRYTALEQSPSHAVLEGPPSPLSGVTFTKTYRLEGGGLTVSVRATNTSAHERSWDLWSVTRFAGETTAPFVPLPEKQADFWVKWDSGNPQTRGMVFYEVVDGHFTLQMGADAGPGTARNHVKYFMNPGAPYLAAFQAGICFRKQIEIAAEDPAPNQGRVEIYANRSHGEPGLLEVEHHGPYTTLQPGESMELRERWELHRYSGAHQPTAQTAFLRSLDRE
jgi:hypothetical protein